MKLVKYKITREINRGTEEAPDIVRVFMDKEIRCNDNALKANEEIAQREAYNGEYTIVDDGQPEPETPDVETVTWDELDEAYQEGVDSV